MYWTLLLEFTTGIYYWNYCRRAAFSFLVFAGPGVAHVRVTCVCVS